jgi:hypothetical protein
MFDKIIIRANRNAPGFKFTVWDAYGVTADGEAFINCYHKLKAAQDMLAAYPQTASTPVEVVR